ncbi:MAG TPA: hypothetical protein VGE51_11875 [Fontimonas sp.]
MTLATLITAPDFKDLIASAYEAEPPTVAAAESELGEALEHFSSPAEIVAKAAQCIEQRVHNYAFGFWYPSMKGEILERRVDLDPPRDGKTFRHSLSGWGIIRIHLYAAQPGTLQCRIAVNSEARARSREDRHPELGPVSAWDWRVVETYAFRLSRKLAAMGRTAPVAQPGAADDSAPTPAAAPARAGNIWPKR